MKEIHAEGYFIDFRGISDGLLLFENVEMFDLQLSKLKGVVKLQRLLPFEEKDTVRHQYRIGFDFLENDLALTIKVHGNEEEMNKFTFQMSDILNDLNENQLKIILESVMNLFSEEKKVSYNQLAKDLLTNVKIDEIAMLN